MMRIRLITLDPALERAAAQDFACRDAIYREDWPELASAVQRLAAQTLETGRREIHSRSGARSWIPKTDVCVAVGNAAGDLKANGGCRDGLTRIW